MLDEVEMNIEEKDKKQVDKRPAMTETDIDVLSYAEQMFWTKQEIPSQEIIAEGLGISIKDVEKSYKKESVRNALIARGIPLSSTPTRALSPTQIMLVNMLLNMHDKRSVREKLKELNDVGMKVTTQQYNTWLRDPVFQEYLRIRTEHLFQTTDFDAYRALAQAVQDGDVPALKLFFEMRGIYNPKVQLDISVETVVLRVIEIVAKHVKDPNVMDAIATDIEELGRAS